MSWIGGKKALRDEIISRFPTDYKRYIEVFGGGGWVLFHKAPGNDFEVYNDRNPNLANLYRCVRDHPDELISELTYALNSRTDFDYIRKIMKTPTEIPDVKRAAYFYQLIRYSYASGLDSYASQPHSMWNNFPLITNACARLQKVVIENKDFEKLIDQYDRPESFFYCDPPYFETEDYYEDESRGAHIESISRLSNIAQRYEAGKQYDELIISNYDTKENRDSIRQLSFADMIDET